MSFGISVGEDATYMVKPESGCPPRTHDARSTASQEVKSASGSADSPDSAKTVAMDELQSTLREIELCKDEIERVLQDTASSSEDLLLLLKRSVTVACSHSRKVPFTVGGGAQDGQLIYVDEALGEKVRGQLQPGDILITVNRT